MRVKLTEEERKERKRERDAKRVDPDYRAKKRERDAKYRADPENKAKRRERDAKRRADSEYKAKHHAWMANWYAKPENKARAREWSANWRTKPENKAKERERSAKRRADPEYKARARERTAKWYAKPENKAKQRAYSADPENRAKRRELDKDKKRDWALRCIYGVSLETFNEMLESQGHRCANCRTDTPGGLGWHLDHCHSTRKVRQILCNGCNAGLGQFKDNPAFLRSAADYVEWHRGAPIAIRICLAPRVPRELSAKEKQRDRWLRWKYGISLETFNEMLESQGRRCAICRTDKPRGHGWQLDHCHDTRKIRAILCHGCNTGLGYFKDNPERLRAAADYVERHRGTSITIPISNLLKRLAPGYSYDHARSFSVERSPQCDSVLLDRDDRSLRCASTC